MPIRSLNILGLLGISGVLLVAFIYQLVLGELPCPLCLLQRGAFVALGLGFLLNIRFGSSPAHYGLMLMGAVIGAGISLRQVLLHIRPGDRGYGTTLLGLHFYSWALAAFTGSMLYAGLLLLLEGVNPSPERASKPVDRLAAASLWLFALLEAGNLASTLLECGLGPCADNPTVYDWLHS
jgi:disulfide bond formation protein DsbB